jgi:hypothetical protein
MPAAGSEGRPPARGGRQLATARRAKNSAVPRQARDPWRRFAARAGLRMFGLAWPIAVLWALAFTELTD